MRSFLLGFLWLCCGCSQGSKQTIDGDLGSNGDLAAGGDLAASGDLVGNDLTVTPPLDLFGVTVDLVGSALDQTSTSMPDLLQTAVAMPIAVTNPSFENPATPPDSFIVSGPPMCWSAYGSINNNNRSVGVLNPNTTTLYLDPVPHGSNVGVVFLMDNQNDQTMFANSPAGLQQTLAAVLMASSQYTLTVEVGNLNVAGGQNAFAFTGFPHYRVELLAGGVVLASDNNTLLPGEGRFLTSTVTFSTGASHAQLGQALGVRLINLNAAIGIEVNFDDVKLTRLPL